MVRSVLAAAILASPIAAGVAVAQEPVTTFTGTATYEVRIALPPIADIVVALLEAEGGLPGASVAVHSETLDGRQVPIPFRLTVPTARLVPDTAYALEVGFRLDGRMGWLSDSIAVEASDETVDIGEVRLRLNDPVAFASRFLCGDVLVRFGVRDGGAVMDAGGQRFSMVEAVAASGARYEAQDDPGTFIWNKGDGATVSVRGEELAPCTQVADRPSGRDVLGGTEWVVDTLDGEAVIPVPPATLEFSEDGGLYGRASCNRFSTSFATNGARIAVGPRIATTQMACEMDVLEQERRILEVLAAARTWSVGVEGDLTLETGDGRSVTAGPAPLEE